MSDTQHDRPAGPGAPGGDWWGRRPRRSANDRKIAGVAGGIGRAFGVDPVLIRIGFVILTIFGGFGGLLYVLGWLLLPADGDEVSAAEALIGRGQSSTPPILTVGLAVIAAIATASMFSWGMPFWPLVIGGIIAITVARKRVRNGGCAARNNQQGNGDWAAQMGRKGESWGAQAEQWVARQPWSGTAAGKPADPSSPFEKPAFWDEDTNRGAGNADSMTSDGASKVNLNKSAPNRPADPEMPVEPKPPAWDPLGVAPFAWDLPEPSPAPPAAPAQRDRGVVGRVTMGAVLLIGGLATVGVLAGWWQLSWAAVSATALAVVAIGLLIGSLRGRGLSLIGPGIFLSFLTLALTVTGINGTSGYGQQTWAPTSQANLSQEYVLNGGQGVLDLRHLTVPAGQIATTQLDVRAGQASVIVPDDVAVNVTCSTNVGEVDCLGQVENGVQKQTTASQQGSTDQGTINLDVHVGAGQAQVRHG